MACHLQIDADPDLAYQCDPDPDPSYHFNPDPTFQFDADPDPQQWLRLKFFTFLISGRLPRLNVYLTVRNQNCGKNTIV